MIKSVQDVLNFGRSGAGAPVKDSSGKVKAVVVGNPEIRFQENEGVQKSIQNAIRYHADKDFKSQYHADLGEFTITRDPEKASLIGRGPSRLCSDWLRSWCCYASSLMAFLALRCLWHKGGLWLPCTEKIYYRRH